MKYIKLFEGFESDILTKTISFLKKKKDLSNDNLKRFTNDIKSLSTLDFPVSRIKDNDIAYLKKIKAVKVRNTTNVLNQYGIYCIKYWFSLEKGYLGFTGTGNLTSDYEKVKRKLDSHNDPYRPKILNNEQYRYIYQTLGIKTGILKPVLDYRTLNTGDDILFAFGETYNRHDSGIVRGKIFAQEDNHIFALHNKSERGGQRPTGTNEERALVNSFGFTNSWSLGYKNNPSDDHCLLQTYVDDGEPLRYIVDDKEVKMDLKDTIKIENYLDFNLPCSYNKLHHWKEGNIDIGGIVEESDFAIVLYLDNILTNVDKKSEIVLGRRKSRLGSSFLSSNNDIKDENIDRYLNKIFSKHGIDSEKQELLKLEKLVNSILCGKFFIIDMYNDSYIIDKVKRLGDLINILIERSLSVSQDSGRKEIRVEEVYNLLLNFYKDKRINSTKKFRKYTLKLIKLQNSGSNDDIIKVFNEIVRIGYKIEKYIENSKMESLEDIRMMYFKLKSIYGVLTDSNFILSNEIVNLINNFDNNNNIFRRSYDNVSDDMRKLKLIENYIDSILK